MTDPVVRGDERLDDLQRSGLRILQKTREFRFGTDAVLLADFAGVRLRDRVADLGTGTGILPLLLYGREPTAVFDAIEIQPEMAEMAGRSIALNGLTGSIRVHEMNLCDAPRVLGHGRYDLVVCNPPYARRGASLVNPGSGRATARHERHTTIEDIAKAAAGLLRNGGRAAFVFPAQRMLELAEALRGVRLEPKRVRLVQAHPQKAPHLVLMEAVRNGGRQLHFLPVLYLMDAQGNPTQELQNMYTL